MRMWVIVHFLIGLFYQDLHQIVQLPLDQFVVFLLGEKSNSHFLFFPKASPENIGMSILLIMSVTINGLTIICIDLIGVMHTTITVLQKGLVLR